PERAAVCRAWALLRTPRWSSASDAARRRSIRRTAPPDVPARWRDRSGGTRGGTRRRVAASDLRGRSGGLSVLARWCGRERLAGCSSSRRWPVERRRDLGVAEDRRRDRLGRPGRLSVQDDARVLWR